MSSILLALAVVAAAQELPSWTFDDPVQAQAWEANGQLTNVGVKDGALCADAVDWDPFFTVTGFTFPATPWQYVVIRIKANQTGSGELFWSGTDEGPYGGFSQDRSQRWRLEGDGAFHDVAVFPFWQADKSIKKLRVDLYDDAHFEIDAVEIRSWGDSEHPEIGRHSWGFEDSDDTWRVDPAATERFSPPMKLPVDALGWATIELQADVDGVGTFMWVTDTAPGLQSESFTIRGGSRPRAYNVELEGHRAWKGTILALGIRLPEEPPVSLHSIALGERPGGPPELAVTYFGFENGVNRAGESVPVMVRVSNLGAGRNGVRDVQLEVPDGLTLTETPAKTSIEEGLGFEEYADRTWHVRAEHPGTYPIRVLFAGKGVPADATTELTCSKSLNLPDADYVPAPQPVETTLDVAAYYFPGWDSPAKWDPVRRVAPVRKPLLGYYDEGNPECVDWQIKWAVENGIKVFLVDWYWVKGNQHLTHWFEAYKQARYRDKLKVAIMWANHNPPGTHSREDWRNVTREWIDKYFGMDSYYRINGRPALFLWDPRNLRNDLNGSEGAKAALDDSQQMAREAGYDGIEFVAVNTAESPAYVQMLLAEGYAGATNYHEWGTAADGLPAPRRARYEDVVATAPQSWQRRNAMCGALTYYPLVDTGWDSRPWHGDKSLVIAGRTPERFERLLREAKDFCASHDKKLVILGPVNEWGEGSYIEPCTEYGFAMLEAVRNVFAEGDPASWPVNVAPSDMGRGPYDYPPVPVVTSWEFENGPEGWAAMMNVGEFRAADGALRFISLGRDPAIVTTLAGVQASAFHQAEVVMGVTGPLPSAMRAQLFWSRGGNATSEAASVSIPLASDGETHTYTFDLQSHPRWRGAISALRFDPCDADGVEVEIDAFRLR